MQRSKQTNKLMMMMIIIIIIIQFSSIRVSYLRENLTAQRPITKLARVRRRHKNK
jgi:ABC-type uncharacterized transport system involved in gliding motility auxiliary subunit